MSERPVDELEQLKSAFDELDSAYVDLLEQNKLYREAYSYLKSAIEFDRYVCHEKCQDVVSVKELEEGLLLFEELEESE